MPDNTFKGLDALGQIQVPVQDLTRAVSFYKEQLGLSFLFQVERMAFFDCDGLRLMLGLPESEAYDHPSSILYFRVDDIEDSQQALQSNGVAFMGDPHLVAKMPDHDLWMSFFQDSEGNTMALMSEREQVS